MPNNWRDQRPFAYGWLECEALTVAKTAANRGLLPFSKQAVYDQLSVFVQQEGETAPDISSLSTKTSLIGCVGRFTRRKS
jgi:hypothetical protein